MTRTICAIAVVSTLTGPLYRAQAQDSPSRVLVLDQQARTVTALEVPGGRAAQTASLEGVPTALLVTADRRRLLVLDRGEGQDAGESGYQARTRSAVTILDGQTLAVQGRVALSWGLEPVTMLSADGARLSVVGPGFQGRTPADSLPREVVTVDLASAQVLSRIELPRRATATLATPEGRTAVVLSAREEPRKGAAVPAELRFLDLTTGTVSATVTLEGNPGGPVLSPDGRFLYLLDRGRPSNSPDKNVNGRLHVVSMETRAVQGVLDAGSKPRGLVLDAGGRQLFMLSDGAPVKGPANRDRPGELRVIRDGAVSATIPVGTSPERLQLSADGSSVYALGTYSVAKVSLPDLKSTPPMTFKILGEELRVSPDGSRLYMVNGEYFSTFDLATGTRIEQVRTGRMGKKMFLALEAGLKSETARLEAENEARRDGRSYYAYSEYTLDQPRGTIAIRGDGKAVYALNSQTLDVTVIDAVSGAILEKVPAGGFTVLFMPPASVALVPSASTVHVVDLATHQKGADVVSDTSGNFNRAELSPDGRMAVIHGSGGIVVVDASSGSPVGTFKRFGKIVGLDIAWAGER
jgi:DNA-binding beta-propeller fold protein YncE